MRSSFALFVLASSLLACRTKDKDCAALKPELRHAIPSGFTEVNAESLRVAATENQRAADAVAAVDIRNGGLRDLRDGYLGTMSKVIDKLRAYADDIDGKGNVSFTFSWRPNDATLGDIDMYCR